MGSVIYGIQDVGTKRIKIGHTNREINKRLIELKCFSAGDLKLRFLIDGGRKEEKLLHSIFKYSHHHGEWYSLDSTLTGFYNGIRKTYKGRIDTKEELIICLDRLIVNAESEYWNHCINVGKFLVDEVHYGDNPSL